MNWWQRFRRSSAHTQANIVCTFLIMLATIVYTVTAWRQLQVMRRTLGEMQRSGEQSTEQMWSAIMNINWMARSMDWSQKVSKQAIDLGSQQSTQALQTATRNARADLRAYIVTTMYQDSVRDGCEHFGQWACVEFQYINVGKSPAVYVEITAYLSPDQEPGEGIREATMKNMSVAKYTGLAGTVLGSSYPEGAIASEPRGQSFLPCKARYHWPPCGHTIYGLIQYKDIFGLKHETGFCTYFNDSKSAPPHSCNFGNWFDARPKGYKIEEQ